MFKFVAFCLCLMAWPAWATPSFGIEPFKSQLAPADGQNTQIFTLTNSSDDTIAVQIHMESWSTDLNGQEQSTVDTTNFSVYPTQFALKAHSNRTVRVTWLGPMPVQTEKAFRLVAEQLPVNFNPGAPENALRFLLRYRTAFYIAPSTPRQKLVVSDFQHNINSNTLVFTLANQGNVHVMLHQPVLNLTDSSGRTHTLRDVLVRSALENNNVLSGGQRQFSIPWPKEMGDNQPKALSIDYIAGF